jgi:putative ATP-dependent endonuclease of the OLD family
MRARRSPRPLRWALALGPASLARTGAVLLACVSDSVRRRRNDEAVKIRQVDVSRYRGWLGPVTWRPGAQSALIGPNNGGKSSLLRAIDLVLNPHRNPYREPLSRHDFFDLDTSEPVEITVVLDDLGPEDCDVFEAFLEGQAPDGSFGHSDSPEEEFDQGDLVLRLVLRADVDAPSRAVFARPDAGQPTVGQDHKMRIGWHLVSAGLDPLRELAFYSNSVFAKLFERVDLSAELHEIRAGIETAKTGLMQEPHIAETKARLESAAHRLRLVEGADALDFQVLDLSDRRVLQSLQLVLRGRRSSSHLPLRSHGGGVLRTLLLAAVMQQAQIGKSNLILAVEEPEQNLEPINQRLVMRSLLLAPDSGAAQVLLSTHSPDVASVLPLADLHLVRHFSSGPGVKSLRDAATPEHRFFERHARGALVDGLYADLVVLVEGPTEQGALPVLWQKAFPGDGLEERRIELIECESVTKMPSFARFFSEAGVPVAAVCDSDQDKAADRAEIMTAGAGTMVRWQRHTDWEGVLAAEAEMSTLCAALEEIRAGVRPWNEHAGTLRDLVRQAAGDAQHLASATDIPSLVEPYDEGAQRDALAALLRGNAPSFKSARDQRLIAAALPDAPPTVKTMIEHIHGFAEGDSSRCGDHPL